MLRAASTIVDLTAIADEHRLTRDLGPLAPDVFTGAEERADGTASVEDRVRRFDAVAILLRQVSLRFPLVVVLDDLHAADRPSLLLPRHVAGNLSGERLLIVANHRDRPARRPHRSPPACGTRSVRGWTDSRRNASGC
ncbi:hypothetical protein [Saccharothrix deserti]|uniref:hypothetical protein n=1 Tax=Saccharothrix deserti TaxID=2593674 RepID=UPI001EE3E3DE|nr:hypothetical protein [Saccharothrix deserti]